MAMGPPYDELFRDYVKELRAAHDEVQQWWQGLMAGAGNEQAKQAIRLRWPAGPASHPRIIAVYRKYYLQCEALNEKLTKDREARRDAAKTWGQEEDEGPGIIQPPGLLLESLETGDKELSKFMGAFVFAPIGIDPDGNTA